MGRSGRIDIIRNFKIVADFYARVAFLAPEPQASLARNERETLVTVKLNKCGI